MKNELFRSSSGNDAHVWVTEEVNCFIVWIAYGENEPDEPGIYFNREDALAEACAILRCWSEVAAAPI